MQVVFFLDDDGAVPVLNWLQTLKPRVVIKCRLRIERLQQLGHQLRRPEADYLKEKIYELRIGLNHVNYRILYFFHGTRAAVLAHAITKEDRVSGRDIELAIRRRRKFETDPVKHTYTE